MTKSQKLAELHQRRDKLRDQIKDSPDRPISSIQIQIQLLNEWINWIQNN